MDTWTYGVAIRRDGTDHVVTVRDLPSVVTSGDSLDDALAQARDAIEIDIGFLIAKNRPIPVPSAVLDGEHPVGLPARMAFKVAIYEAWREAGLTKSELARRMGRSETEARRILDPGHGTKIDQLEEAAKALGKRITLALTAA